MGYLNSMNFAISCSQVFFKVERPILVILSLRVNFAISILPIQTYNTGCCREILFLVNVFWSQ